AAGPARGAHRLRRPDLPDAAALSRASLVPCAGGRLLPLARRARALGCPPHEWYSPLSRMDLPDRPLRPSDAPISYAAQPTSGPEEPRAGPAETEEAGP